MTEAFAQAAMPQASQSGSLIQFILMMVILIVIWHFLIIRPQKKQQEDHNKMISALGKNDEVVTSGGIHGTIVNVKETTFVLKIDDEAKMEIQKNSIAGLRKKKESNNGGK